MDRQAILRKIAAMLQLQEASNFDGETSAAAGLIDKLCQQYGVTIQEATEPQVLKEDFEVYKKLDEASFILFSAVARFYDGLGISHSSYATGRKVTTLKCVGTEAQQIQTRLYYDFLKAAMIRDCEVAMAGEKILAELQGNRYHAYGFRANYCKAFVAKVRDRLHEMKLNREDHPDKQYTKLVIDKMRLTTHTTSAAAGMAASLGANAGANASLHRQTSGSQTRALCGAR
jgi:hypothetical protein